jgi:hypothetical protein
LGGGNPVGMLHLETALKIQADTVSNKEQSHSRNNCCRVEILPLTVV